MSELVRISIENFIGKYEPRICDNNDESFNRYVFPLDSEEVKKQIEDNPLCVWTWMVDGDGLQWLQSGMHFVNRDGFVITKTPRASDELDIQANDEIWTSKSKCVIGVNKEIENLDEYLTQPLDEIRNSMNLGPYDISFSIENIGSERARFHVVHIECLWDEKPKEELDEFHQKMKEIGEKLRSDFSDVWVFVHEPLSSEKLFGEYTDNTIDFFNCSGCGYSNRKHDWLDEGETCPRCKLVN